MKGAQNGTFLYSFPPRTVNRKTIKTMNVPLSSPGAARWVGALAGLLLATGCAKPPTGIAGRAELGSGFTHSALRAHLCETPLEDPNVKPVALRTSLLIFGHLEACDPAPTDRSAPDDSLVYRGCKTSETRRTADFAIRSTEGRSWNLRVTCDSRSQAYSTELAPLSTPLRK